MANKITKFATGTLASIMGISSVLGSVITVVNAAGKTIHCGDKSFSQYTFNRTDSAGSDLVEGVYAVYSKLTGTAGGKQVKPILTPLGKFLKDKEGIYQTKIRPQNKSGGIGESSEYRRNWEEFSRQAKQKAQETEEWLKKDIPELHIATPDINKLARGGIQTYTLMKKKVKIFAQHSQDKYDEWGCETEQAGYWGDSESRSDAFVTTDDCKAAGEAYGPHGSWYCSGSFSHGGKGQRVESDVPDNGEYTSDGKNTMNTYLYVKPWITYTIYKRVHLGGNRQIDGNYTENTIRPEGIDTNNWEVGYSYQIITAKCNQKLLSSLPQSKVLFSSKGSTTIMSPIVEKKVATFYNHISKDELYNGKDCDNIYGCSGKPNPGAQSDSKNNKSNDGKLIDNQFGAQSEDKLSSKFIFFRDNNSHLVRNDVWWLNKKEDAPEFELDAKAPAIATYITLDKTGTPTGELFNLENASKQTIIPGTTITEKWSAVFKSEENKFHWRAGWATDKEHPHKMNITYAYKPKVVAQVPKNFRNLKVDTEETKSILDILCPVDMNNSEETAPQIKNGEKELTHSSPMTKFNNNKNRYIEVNFVKSSAE